MKFNLRRFLIIPIIFFCSLNANADPFYCSSLGGTGCMLYRYSKPLYLCTGQSIDLYARSTIILYSNPPCSSPTYQWYRWEEENGWLVKKTLSGETDNIITVVTAGLYECRVSCSGQDNYTTSPAWVYFSSTNPSITQDPDPDQVCLGESAGFSAFASGDYFGYQWQVKEPLGNWKTIRNALSKDYSFIPVEEDDQNEYRCVVSNGCFSDISSPALLRVKTPPEVNLDPVNDSVCENSAGIGHLIVSPLNFRGILE